MACIGAGPMLDAADVLEVLYEVVDKLALALGGPQLFQSAYQVGFSGST